MVATLDFGGAEQVTATLARGAQTAGHDVAVAARAGTLSNAFDCLRFEVPVVRRRLEALPLAAWRLRRAITMFHPDIVHCHNPGTAVVAAGPTRRGRRPIGLVTVHGVADDDWPTAVRALRYAGLVAVACGPAIAARLADGGLFVRTTIAPGIAAAAPPADAAALRQEWNLPRDIRLVVSVGRLVVQKNHAVAIEAMRRVPEAALVIVGDGPLRSELGALADRCGAKVLFAGSRADARRIIGAADVVLLTSDWEGMPLVVIEALSAGRPVVATSIPATRQFLRHDIDAVLVPAGDSEAVAAALLRVLSDRVFAAGLACAGPGVAAGYTEAAMIDSYLRLYDELITER